MSDPTSAAPPAGEQILDAEGHFHVEDAPVELGHYVAEDWFALAFFWLLGLCVFYQFFTRYALNDSAAWTEEVARYLLICVVFIGISASVRRTRHIHVDFVYRYVPPRVARIMSTLIDLGRIAFFAIAVALTIQMMTKMTSLKMTIIELPMNIVYAMCALGFAAATVRSAQVAVENLRRGHSVLERPEMAIEETIQ